MEITGVELFIKALRREKVDTLFGYPGGYVISLFDALYDCPDIRVVLPRHEQALVHEADGYARASGRVGVCLVTSGPGATNVVTGLATANYDSVPLVCFTGQTKTRLIGNDAFQEVDIVGITRSITKHSIVVTDRSQLGRIIKEAFHIASTGKPGPVLVDLPTDIMDELGSPDYPEEVNMRSYKFNANVHMGQLKRAVANLMEARKPLFLAGGGIRVANAEAEFLSLAEKTRAPVVSTVMGRGAIPTNHPLYVGNMGMHGCYAANQAVSEADLLFCIGTRFNDRITGNLEKFAPNAKIVHIDVDPASISRTIKVDIPIVGDAKKAVTEMLSQVKALDTEEWLNKITGWNTEFPLVAPKAPGLSPFQVIQAVNEVFPDATITTDVGQHQMWVSQFVALGKDRKFLTSGGLGTMGYGLPSAIGAQIAHPDRPVVSFSGDGGFQMNLQELATAVTEELPVVAIIFNNGNLGMVRQWQKLFHEKRFSATCLRYRRSCHMACKNGECPMPPYSPDFVRLAESYGAMGIRITENDEIIPALMMAKKAKNAPVVIECIIDPNIDVLPMVAPGHPLSDMILEVEP